MQDLFNKWKTLIVRYGEEFKPLFDDLSNKGGGSTIRQTRLGKHFSNNYELYIYAFFLGLYRGEYNPILEGTKKDDFSHAIQFWGHKTGRAGRKDFSYIQESIFAAAIAKTDLDFIALEKGELTETEAANALRHTVESYANGGLTLISEKLEDNPQFFLDSESFLNMILSVSKGEGPTEL